MKFASDTASSVHPKVLEAITLANAATVASYGADDWTKKAEAMLSDLFEAPLRASFVSSGTASNALALATLCPPTGGIIAHPQAHINCDERGAVEFYSAGAKILPVAGDHGRINPALLDEMLQKVDENFVHAIPPKALCLSNLTEAGTGYSPAQVASLSGLAKAKGLGVHMDGARLANALAFYRVRPADITWASGVDILSFGLSKTGAMAAETILLFSEHIEQFEQLEARRKRGGHMPPKQRFVAAQVIAMLENDLWLETASHANLMAQKLETGLQNAGITILHPVEGNEVFARLSLQQTSHLQENGAAFYAWPDGSVRFVTSWNTSLAQIEQLLVLL
ncbi:Low-specificity L-threonine aldolase [hydrothermal vent metagenome]|uniref:Low-specificity L-threonine aldolase n=1 Tax=hydrothermal vent metagenome TaxID=652676 RepID=A0A3B0RIN0_9ZZZZ